MDLATEAPIPCSGTADGLALEGLLGTEAPEEGLVERIALREAVDKLPEKERMTILLRYFKGLTQERAARVLGVSQVAGFPAGTPGTGTAAAELCGVK